MAEVSEGQCAWAVFSLRDSLPILPLMFSFALA